MDFEKRFEAPAVLAKWLEFRWFYSPENEGVCEGHDISVAAPQLVQHRMPFLRRNLSFVIKGSQRSRDQQSAHANSSIGSLSGRKSGKRKKTIATSSEPENPVILGENLNLGRRNGLKPTGTSKDVDGHQSDVNGVIVIDSSDSLSSDDDDCQKARDKLYNGKKLGNDKPGHKTLRYGQSALLNEYSEFVRSHKRRKRTRSEMTSFATEKRISGKCRGDGRSSISPINGLHHRRVTIGSEKERSHRKHDRANSASSGHARSKCDQGRRNCTRGNRRAQTSKGKGDSSQVKSNGEDRSGYADDVMPVSQFVFFYYLYIDADNFPAAQIEKRTDRRCPLCSLDVCTDVGLLLHCRATHSEFLFEAAKDEEGFMHMLVRSNGEDSLFRSSSCERLMNFTYVRREQSREWVIPFVKRPFRKAATLDLVTRKKKISQLHQNGAKEDSISRFFRNSDVPVRQYYHSRTNLPMLHGDWRYDSDEEADEDWLLEVRDGLLNEFEDVSDKEKTFMKLWNRFIISCTTISDRIMASRCLAFIKIHCDDLIELGLRHNLLLHLFNLWDSGVISSSHICKCMSELDSLNKKRRMTEKRHGNNEVIRASHRRKKGIFKPTSPGKMFYLPQNSTPKVKNMKSSTEESFSRDVAR